MDCLIREMRKDEYPLLDDFLYEAIFIPAGYGKEVPRDIMYTDPQVYAAIADFGTHPADDCLVAEVDGRVVGAVWVRTRAAYGHIDAQTPSFSISLYRAYRHCGIGTALMEGMLARCRESGYKRASLGVSKENYAVKLYEKVGFRIVGDGADATEWLMVCDLQ